MEAAPDLGLVCAGVDPAWLPYFCVPEFLTALKRVSQEPAVPPLDLLLEAFRYGGPGDAAVVVLGEDPYIHDGQARGLCFSVAKGVALPPSMRNILACLARSGYPRVSGDLRPWAADRVLLLNTALTTEPGRSGAHLKTWAPFTKVLLRSFCAARAGAPLHFLLWGNPARAHAGVVREHGHFVHEWTHPSPQADNMLAPSLRFRECPHFADVNAALALAGARPIAWDTHAPVVAFTDGGCSDNGAPSARASFAAVIVGGCFAGCSLRGEVRPSEYAFADPAVPESGVLAADAPVQPSNNRGELLGIIYAFLALLRGRALGRVEVVSDSNVCIQTLKEWLPNRIKKGTERKLKNFDLVMLAWGLLGALRAQAAEVVLTWTESHVKGPAPKEARARLLRKGNDRADALCTGVLKRHVDAGGDDSERYHVDVLGGPAVLRGLAG